MSVTALKEWSAAVHAMLDGRQTVLLRKGGIAEKRFDVTVGTDAGAFVFFPTVAHGHAERVRVDCLPLVEAAACDSTDTELVLRAGAKVVAAVSVNRPDGLNHIEDLHIWTAASVQADRLDFRPKHRLTVLVVQAIPLLDPLRLPRTAAHAGCRSWLDLAVSPEWGAPVHDEQTLALIAERVRASVA